MQTRTTMTMTMKEQQQHLVSDNGKDENKGKSGICKKETITATTTEMTTPAATTVTSPTVTKTMIQTSTASTTLLLPYSKTLFAKPTFFLVTRLNNFALINVFFN